MSPHTPGAHLPEHPDFLWRDPEPRRCVRRRHHRRRRTRSGDRATTSSRTMASPTSQCSRRAGWPAATWPATPPYPVELPVGRSAGIYEHSLKLWEGLEDDLGYPILFSQRGVLNLAHTLQDVRDGVRRVQANRLNGIDARVADARRGQGAVPDRQHLGRICGTRYWAPPISRAPESSNTITSLGVSLAGPTGRRRHHPGLRGDRVRHGRGRAGRPACGPPAATSRAGEVALSRGRPHLGARRDGSVSGVAAAEPSAAGAGLGTARAGPPDVVMSNAVHVYVQPGAQGRAGDGRRHRLLQLVRAARRVPRHRAADGRGAGAVPGLRAARTLLRTWGGIVDVDARCVAGGRAHAVPRPVPQLRMGHRRIQGDAGYRLGVWRDTIANDEPHPSSRLTRSTDSSPAPWSTSTAPPAWRTDRRHEERKEKASACSSSIARIAGPARKSNSTTADRRMSAIPPTPGPDRRRVGALCVLAGQSQGGLAERWCHSVGCRRWFNAVRDTATYRFDRVYRHRRAWADIMTTPFRTRPEAVDREVSTNSPSTERLSSDTQGTRWHPRCSPTACTRSRPASNSAGPRYLSSVG